MTDAQRALLERVFNAAGKGHPATHRTAALCTHIS